MNTRHITIGITAAVMLASSALVFAADAAKAETPKAANVKKPLGKLTCEDFIAIDDVIKPQYIIAAVAYTKGGKAKKCSHRSCGYGNTRSFSNRGVPKGSERIFLGEVEEKVKTLIRCL
jgi:hypothetical protein